MEEGPAAAQQDRGRADSCHVQAGGGDQEARGHHHAARGQQLPCRAQRHPLEEPGEAEGARAVESGHAARAQRADAPVLQGGGQEGEAAQQDRAFDQAEAHDQPGPPQPQHGGELFGRPAQGGGGAGLGQAAQGEEGDHGEYGGQGEHRPPAGHRGHRAGHHGGGRGADGEGHLQVRQGPLAQGRGDGVADVGEGGGYDRSEERPGEDAQDHQDGQGRGGCGGQGAHGCGAEGEADDAHAPVAVGQHAP